MLLRTIRPAPIELLLVRDETSGFRLRRTPGYARVRSGVYAATAAWRALAPWDRYLARVHAYALVHPGAVFSHESAAVLAGMPVFGEPRDIHVFDQGAVRSRRLGDVVVHTSQDPREIVDSLDGLSLTSMGDTAIDLARVLPPAFALATVDSALSLMPGIAVAELKERAARQAARRGRRTLEWLWEHTDRQAESPGESVSRAVIMWWGFERPEIQITFRNEGFEDRVDFYWRERRVIGESDGYAKYGTDPDHALGQVIAEKRREDRLRRHQGAFARWDWADALRATPLRDKLLAAGIVPVRPPQLAMLATLRSHPRSDRAEARWNA